MLEEKIWNFVHTFKTKLTKDQRESYKSFVTGTDNYYIFSFPVTDNINPTGFKVIQFKISKNYHLTTSKKADSGVSYVIDAIQFDGVFVDMTVQVCVTEKCADFCILSNTKKITNIQKNKFGENNKRYNIGVSFYNNKYIYYITSDS